MSKLDEIAQRIESGMARSGNGVAHELRGLIRDLCAEVQRLDRAAAAQPSGEPPARAAFTPPATQPPRVVATPVTIAGGSTAPQA